MTRTQNSVQIQRICKILSSTRNMPLQLSVDSVVYMAKQIRMHGSPNQNLAPVWIFDSKFHCTSFFFLRSYYFESIKIANPLGPYVFFMHVAFAATMRQRAGFSEFRDVESLTCGPKNCWDKIIS